MHPEGVPLTDTDKCATCQAASSCRCSLARAISFTGVSDESIALYVLGLKIALRVNELSFSSISTDPINLVSESSFGNTPMTCDRRYSSLFNRSM